MNSQTHFKHAPSFNERPSQAFQPTMLVRQVDVYPLTESELDTVASANLLTTLFFSGFVAFASAGLSFWMAGETAGENVSEKAKALFEIVPYLTGGAAIFCLVAAGCTWRLGSSTLKRVKKECKIKIPQW